MAGGGAGGDLEGFDSVEDDERGFSDEGLGGGSAALVGALAGWGRVAEEADELAEAFVGGHGVVGGSALFRERPAENPGKRVGFRFEQAIEPGDD